MQKGGAAPLKPPSGSSFLFGNAESFKTHEEGEQMKRILLSVVVLGLALAIAAPATAQTSTTEVKNGTIVAVGENSLVVKDANGVHKYFETPSGFTVTVDGKETPVSALKPGMHITAAIKTVTTPVVVQTTTLKNAKV